MFEVGRRYTITMSDPSQPGTVHYIRGKVMEFQFPLLKLDLDVGQLQTLLASFALSVATIATAAIFAPRLADG
jgi:hypothetical protein